MVSVAGIDYNNRRVLKMTISDANGRIVFSYGTG